MTVKDRIGYKYSRKKTSREAVTLETTKRQKVSAQQLLALTEDQCCCLYSNIQNNMQLPWKHFMNDFNQMLSKCLTFIQIFCKHEMLY